MSIHVVEQACLIAAAVLMVLLFVPARLLNVTQLRAIRPRILWLAYQGKWLGLATAAAVIGLAVAQVPWWAWSGPTTLLAASAVICIGLAVTSNKWSYAHIKYWKHLNMLVWLLVPFMGVYALAARPGFSPAVTAVVVALLIVCVGAGIAGLYEPKPGYFARHRVWLLGIGLLLAVGVTLAFPA